jgi:hypothetical protein
VRRAVPLTWTRHNGDSWRCECSCGHKSESMRSYHLADHVAALHNAAHLREAVSTHSERTA